MAQSFSDITGVKIVNALKKSAGTKSQKELSRSERIKNLKGALQIENTISNQLFGKSVLLVDDVATTGATLVESAKTLKKYGVKKVYSLALTKD